MQVGVSTSCLFPMETEKALRRLAALGVRRTEIFLNSSSEAKPDFVKELATIARGEGMRVTGLHPYCSDSEGIMFFGRYPRRFSDGLDEYRRMFEACAVLGAPYLIFHGAKPRPVISRERYFERFSRLREEGRKFKTELCQENVARCMSRDLDFLHEMAEAIPDVQFVLDIKQALRSGYSALEAMRAMRGHLSRIHVSDHTELCDCVPPGKGTEDFSSLAAEAESQGFLGDWMIELYRWNFDEEIELAVCEKKLKVLIQTE